MNVFELPFNKFIGLQPSSDAAYLLMLANREEYLNHLNTVHASAQFALAEATSGYFLLNEFQEETNILPVVRKVETKYRKPAKGDIFSKACFVNITKENFICELNDRKRASITVRVSLYDSAGVNVMQADFEWFVARK